MKRDVSQTLRTLLAAKQTVARLEHRFLKQLTAAFPATNSRGPSGRTRPPHPTLRRALKCRKCARRFARPLHLGRHSTATHGRKKMVAKSRQP